MKILGIDFKKVKVDDGWKWGDGCTLYPLTDEFIEEIEEWERVSNYDYIEFEKKL